jgi:hypothetical protein
LIYAGSEAETISAGGKNLKRDNQYYLEKLRVNFPQIHSDLLAGLYKNVAEARRAAGTLKPRTPLNELMNGWSKATASERDAFRIHIGCGPSASTLSPPITIDRQLVPFSRRLIADIMTARGLSLRDVADGIGLKRLDTSLDMAFSRGTRLRQSVIDNLSVWVKKNSPP